MGRDTSISERVYEAKGDSIAADALIRDYLPFIRAEASKASGRIITEHDDEASIAMIAFHEAIEGYSRLKGAFLSYASIIMRRKIIDYYRKEKRHMNQSSLDVAVYADDDETLRDKIADSKDAYTDMSVRDATRQEIVELAQQLSDFDVSMTDIADNCPKQERTLAACKKAIQYAKDNPELVEELKRTKRLPIAKLCEGTGVERKTLERHRKYVLALMIIYSNGYEIIRGHLKQVFSVEKGGVTA